MKIAAVDAFPIRLPRDTQQAAGSAGSPTGLQASRFDYRWSQAYPVLYSIHFETALVRLTADDGREGWGEAQAPLAPEVVCAIVEMLLRPALADEEFSGSPERIRELRQRLYSTMRVRGQTGGFMLDAISGVDLALWDLAGKIAGKPAAELVAGASARKSLPAYLSGLTGVDNSERLAQAEKHWEDGFRTFKLFFDRSEAELFDLIDRLRRRFGSAVRIAVDALWRLNESDCRPFTEALDERGILWLECPLPPEDAAAHARLAAYVKTPLALGESYRTRFELQPFFERNVFAWLQPDLGRCGITEAVEWARLAQEAGIEIAPHVSIAMGPQIAAALHLAAATPNSPLVEYNPKVLEIANRYQEQPIVMQAARYVLPQGPGLGAEMRNLPTAIPRQAGKMTGHRP